MRNVIAGALVEREEKHEAAPEQEQSSSCEPALDARTTAEKAAEDLEARATEGEMTEGKQARLGRLLNELTRDDGATPGSTPDHSQGGQGRPQGGGDRADDDPRSKRG